MWLNNNWKDAFMSAVTAVVGCMSNFSVEAELQLMTWMPCNSLNEKSREAEKQSKQEQPPLLPSCHCFACMVTQ